MKRHLYFDDGNAVRLLTITGEGIDMLMLYAELGKVHRTQNSQAMDAAEVSANVAMALKHGYVELTETEYLDKQKTVESIVEQRSRESFDVDATVVQWEELSATHGHYFVNNPTEYLSKDLRKFCCFDRPVERQSDLKMTFDSLGPTAQTNQRNLIFHHGLKIDGNFDAAGFTSELPLLALVKGDLHCQNLLLNCWAELVVTGNLYVSGIILAYDGETGGRLKVHGNAKAKQIVGGFMYPVEIDGQVDADIYWLEPEEPTLAGAQMIASEFSQAEWLCRDQLTPLVDEAFNADSSWGTGEAVVTYGFNFEFARNLVRRGESIFR